MCWSRSDHQGGWRHERSIYWQVQRGSRGRIYAIASHDNLIALGGHGAMGGLGEILLVDSATGNLQAALYDEVIGHRQVIVSLAFSPDPQRPGLASIDRAGKALYWQPDPQTGLWKPREIQPADTAHYGEAIARRLYPVRGVAPLVMVDGQHVVLPVYAADPRRPNALAWQLQKIDVTAGAKELWPGQQGVYHFQVVTALAVAGDGSRLASADAAGRLFLWEAGGKSATERLDRACVSLAFSDDARTLLAGTAKSPSGQPALVQLWDVADPARWRKRQADIASTSDVYACSLSRDGEYLAYTSGNDVVTRPLRGGSERRLDAAVRPPLRVAFAKNRPFYRIALGTRPQNGRVTLEQTFDTANVQLDTAASVDDSNWLASTWHALGWEVQTRRDPQTGAETYRLVRGGEPKASIPFDPSLHGAPSAWCWIPTAQGEPFAVAIGTGGNNNIYVFRLADRGTCPVLRGFPRSWGKRHFSGCVAGPAVSCFRLAGRHDPGLAVAGSARRRSAR